ncbi:MAG: PEP-CTERM sorting domain-containing protein [Nibricoccus sp.]
MKTKILAALFVLSSSLAHAQLNYSEAVSGDLSGNALLPTVLDFAPGLNTVSGVMGRPPGGAIDRDIFTFHLESWEQVTSINVLQYNPSVTPGVIGSFLAISKGTTTNLTNPSTHLSNILIGSTGEILPFLAAGSYSDSLGNQPATQGLTAPLGGGDYTVWFQELTTPVAYTLGITVAAVPEPSTYAAVGAGLLLLGCIVRRRKSAGVAG